MQISDRGNISVSNSGNGNSGNLDITTSKLSLDNSATIEAKVNSGSQGNIRLDTDNIFLNNQSEITVLASGTATGGNIDIDNKDNIVLLKNSQIIADAIEGNGGNIEIMTQNYFISTDSLVSASSEFGLDGTVEVENINGNRLTELVKLSSALIDATEQITAGCNSNSDFAIAGRGGLPDNPIQGIRGQATWQDLRLTVLDLPRKSKHTTFDVKQNSTQSNNIVEAQRWKVNKLGKVELFARNPAEIFLNNRISCN